MSNAFTQRLGTCVEVAVAVLLRERLGDWIKVALLAVGLALPQMPLFKTTYIGLLFTIVVFLLLRRNGERWEDFGVIVPRAWVRYLGYGLLVFAAALLFDILFKHRMDALVVRLTGASVAQETSAFTSVRGNLPLWLYVQPCIWLFGAIGEELFYRGYLLTRLETLFGAGRVAVILAIVVQAIVFGLGHAYQGPVGMVGVSVFGLFYGAGARLWGRNIWPSVVAHGLLDMLGFTLLYLGVM